MEQEVGGMEMSGDEKKDPVQKVKDEFNPRIKVLSGIQITGSTYDSMCYQIADARALSAALAELIERVPFAEWACLGLDLDRSRVLERFRDRRCETCGSYDRNLLYWPCDDGPSEWHRPADG